jgi:hypothetical protein
MSDHDAKARRDAVADLLAWIDHKDTCSLGPCTCGAVYHARRLARAFNLECSYQLREAPGGYGTQDGYQP